MQSSAALEKVHLYNLCRCTIIKKPDVCAFCRKMLQAGGDKFIVEGK